MNITREQFDQELAGIKDQLAAMGITEDQARRKFFRKAIAPSLQAKGKTDEAKAKLQEWGIVGQAPKARAATNVVDALFAGMNEGARDGMLGTVLKAGAKAIGRPGFDKHWENLTTGGEEVYVTNKADSVAHATGRFALDMLDPVAGGIFRGTAAVVDKIPGARNVIGAGGDALIKGVGKISKQMNVNAPRLAQDAVRQTVAGAPAGGLQALAQASAQGYLDGNIDSRELGLQALAGMGMGALGGAQRVAQMRGNGRFPGKAPALELEADNPKPATPEKAAPSIGSRLEVLSDAKLLHLRDKLEQRGFNGDDAALSLMQRVDHELTKRGKVEGASAVPRQPRQRGIPALPPGRGPARELHDLLTAKLNETTDPNERMRLLYQLKDLAKQYPGIDEGVGVPVQSGSIITMPESLPAAGPKPTGIERPKLPALAERIGGMSVEQLGTMRNTLTRAVEKLSAAKGKARKPEQLDKAQKWLARIEAEIQRRDPQAFAEANRASYANSPDATPGIDHGAIGEELNFLYDLAAEGGNHQALPLITRAMAALNGESIGVPLSQALKEARNAVNPSKGVVEQAAPGKKGKGNQLKVEAIGEWVAKKHDKDLEAFHGQLLSEAKAGYEAAVQAKDLAAASHYARAKQMLDEAGDVQGLRKAARFMGGQDSFVELNAGVTPKNLLEGAKLLGGHLAKADQAIEGGINKGVAAVSDAVAGALNKHAGKEVAQKGIDPITGELRAGEQLAKAYDHLRRDADTGGANEVVDGLLGKVRGALMNDHGLDAEYITRRRQRDADARELVGEGKTIASGLRGMLDEAGEKEVYQALNDRTQTGTRHAEQTEPIRQRIGELSKEQRDLGILSKAQHEAHVDQYLKRQYDKYLKELPVVAKWLKASNTIKGSKSRGKTNTMSQKQFDELSKDWQMVKDNGDGTATIQAGGEMKVVSSKSLGEYLGTWKKLKTAKDGEVTAWRDWTFDERTAMGEHRVASDAVEATFNGMAKDLSNGRFFRDVSKNSKWAVKADAEGKGPEGWKYFNDDRNPNGSLKWGSLAGHYVEPRIAHDIIQADKVANGKGLYRDIVRMWKKNVTSRNPASHVNNFGQNVITLELNGGSVSDLGAARKVLKEGGTDFTELEQAGLFNNTMAVRELANRMNLGPEPTFLEALKTFGEAGKAAVKGDGGAAGRKLVKSIQQADDRATELYGSADDLFRVALVIAKRRQGMALEDAVQLARTRMYHSEINAPALVALRDSGVVPFVSVASWSAAEIPKMIARNPGKALKLAAYWQAYNLIANALNGDDPEKVKAREAMRPDYQKGIGYVAAVPGRDLRGQKLELETRNFMPTNFIDTADRSALPGWPSALMPGGPLATLYGLAINKDPLTQKDIRKPGTSGLEQTMDVAGFIANGGMLPAGLGRSASRFVSGLTGKADAKGRQYDPITGTLSAIGFKLQPIDDEQAFINLNKRFESRAREINEALNDKKKLVSKGSMSPEAFAAYAKQQAEAMQRLRAEQALLFRQAAPALK